MKLSRTASFLFLTLIMSGSSIPREITAEHPIVILISPPRSLSTAFLRMMSSRKDFVCLHEYFTVVYAQNNADDVAIVEDWCEVGFPKTFKEVEEKIIKTAITSPVFVKEMSVPMLDFLSQNTEFIMRKNVYLLLLVRNPHACSISYYRGLKPFITDFSKNPVYPEWLGFEQMFKILKLVQKKAANKPIIIRAEDLYEQPKQTARLLCDHLTIPFTTSMLTWSKLESSFTGVQEWGELKKKQLTEYWHKDAIQTTHFSKQRTYDVDPHGNPTFIEITDLTDREICKKAYQHHTHYYNLLLAETDHLLALPLSKEKPMESEIVETPRYLYKILSLENWEASKNKATLVLSSDDAAFIHFSREDQLERIQTKYWSHTPHVVLKIETSKLPGKMVFETNVGGVAKYYHLYDGCLPSDSAVEHVMALRTAFPATVKAETKAD